MSTVEYLTVREAALELGIHPMTLARWLERGLFPSLAAVPVGYEHGELMTVVEAAARLGVTGQTVKNWCAGTDGIVLGPVRAGRKYGMTLIPVGCFQEFLEWKYPDRGGDGGGGAEGEKAAETPKKMKHVTPLENFRRFQRTVFPTLDVHRGRPTTREAG